MKLSYLVAAEQAALELKITQIIDIWRGTIRDAAAQRCMLLFCITTRVVNPLEGRGKKFWKSICRV